MQIHKFLFASLIALSATTVFADQHDESSQPPAATTQPRGVLTPAVSPRVSNGAGVAITADFIWWRPHIDGMEYAITGTNDGFINIPNFTSVSKGHVKQPDFDFKPGLKVGMGLDFAHDGWDLYGEYTWLYGGNQKNSFSSKSGLGATTALEVATPRGGLTFYDVQSGSSKWRQNFNVVDLTLGRNFFISRNLTLRPSVGLKGAWITEKLDATFYWPEGTINAVVMQMRKQDMWGIGTRLGLDGVWHFCMNWGIYGNVAVTAQWSDFHTRAQDITTQLTNASVAATSTNLNSKETILTVIPVIEAGIGLTYMKWFHNEDYQFQLMVGWEEQIWVNFNHFMEVDRSGDLSLEGLTAKIGFAF